MTNDQTLALQFLDNFADKGWRHACLEGYAGVGKTWLIGHWLNALLKRCPGLRVLVAAPTNKALDVLRGKCGHLRVDFRTLDGYLGYRVKRNEDGDMERHKSGKPLSYDIVVVDEASMVKLSYHRELLAQRVPVLYVGDPAQLQPVGEELSPAFDTEHKCTMTEVVRQAADNPIIQLATYLRQRVEDGGTFLLQDVREMLPGDKRISFTRMQNLLDWADTAIDRGMDSRILAFDNMTVNRNNAAMHARRFPDAPLFGIGERVLVNETFEVNDDLMLMNGQLLTVLGCQQAEPVAGVDVFDVTVPTTGLEVNGEPIDPEITLQVARDEAELLRVHKGLTDAIWEARRNGNHGEADRLAKVRRPLNKLAPLRHSYASTVHKSQGSTYDVAFVDWGSIYRSREMRARLMYVAATRPSQFLVVATN